VPAFFLGAELDVGSWWGAEARARASEVMTDYRGSQVLPRCGHWMQQERPDETNAILLGFLKSLA
jgi:pimeloyl-ACP methyl ester carboxylesterase